MFCIWILFIASTCPAKNTWAPFEPVENPTLQVLSDPDAHATFNHDFTWNLVWTPQESVSKGTQIELRSLNLRTYFIWQYTDCEIDQAEIIKRCPFEILNLFSPNKSKAVRLFNEFCCQINNDNFMDYQEVFREVKEITSVKKAKEYASRYLKEKGLQTGHLKGKVNKENRGELILELKEKTNLSYREIGNILGFSRWTVERKVNKK